MAKTLFALGLGIGTKNSNGEWLEIYYASPQMNVDINDALLKQANFHEGESCIELSAARLSSLIGDLPTEQQNVAKTLLDSKRPLVLTLLDSDQAPQSVPSGYLKLHLLSHRLVKPHACNLNGLFGVLPNVAWTNQGAIAIDELANAQLQARSADQELSVASVDKFPKMVDYVVPSGVRIAHTARVRLGAYLGEGTTIMHEGFVNFNAGTEGPGMIEGRISAGVFVGKGSDLGGGCSTMGTLSGGNNVIISIGEECLIGANAGVGIPLGDRCTIEAGLYLTAGSIVIIKDENGKEIGQVKARDLAGKSDLLFRRHSKTGSIECLSNSSAIVLNEALHANN